LSIARTVLRVRVLVVDDEPAVRDSLKRALEIERYTVFLAADGRHALERLDCDTIDAIVLDVSMPRMDGLELTRRLREAGDQTPILMLTARDAIDDRVTGLDAGADDYLVKPFVLAELYARLRALLRRIDTPTEALTFAGLRLDPITRDVYRGERRIELSRTEHSLLELFLRNPRQVLTRATIFERVWGYDFGEASSSLGVYIGYLRRKTEEAGEPRLLHTVRGVGYILRDDER
jgi:two-component system response regulator MprA